MNNVSQKVYSLVVRSNFSLQLRKQWIRYDNWVEQKKSQII